MHRPKDWKNPNEEYYGKCDIPTVQDAEYGAYEAGADAMLVALKEEGVFTYGHHTPDIDLNDAPEVSGYWVFIPGD